MAKTCFNGALPYHVKERSKDHGIIVTDHNYDAISSVADNLFVIADGYTNPVRCREDRRALCKESVKGV